MLEIDATKLAPNPSQIMAMLGWGMPPLNWQDRHNTTAKSLLEEAAEDSDLFKPQAVQDEALATGVRALLYLWTGWPNDAQMWAAAAPEKERLYIAALAYRHAGNSEESKTQFQALEENPFSDEMCRSAKGLISDHADVLLKRFRDLIELGQAWESFAFTDLLDQARDGDFSHGAQEILRKLQWQEFNMLLQRCYEGATGKDITKREAQARVVESEPAWKRNKAAQDRIRPAPSAPSRKPATEQPGQGDKGANGKDVDNKEEEKSKHFAVKCPKCKKSVAVSESARGKSVKCKCGHSLRIAQAGTDGEPVKAPKTTARLVCPKCRNAANYSVTYRGSKVACLKCRTSFMFAAA